MNTNTPAPRKKKKRSLSELLGAEVLFIDENDDVVGGVGTDCGFVKPEDTTTEEKTTNE